ncbi:MAG: hypothetical protein HY669_00515 [Chloroflexi bacterium]|nr:hypothetical protein [Chloroflexota bacterium]
MEAKASPLLCRAKRKDGSRCRAVATTSGLCLAHDPMLEAKRQAARSAGGHNKAKSVRLGKLVPPRLVPVFDRLEQAMQQVHQGEIDPRVAQALASLAGAMVRVLTSGELEERLRRLESKLEERNVQ